MLFSVSADQEVAAIFGHDVEVEKPKLIRQNTFTKDSELTAAKKSIANAYGQQESSSSSFAATGGFKIEIKLSSAKIFF